MLTSGKGGVACKRKAIQEEGNGCNFTEMLDIANGKFLDCYRPNLCLNKDMRLFSPMLLLSYTRMFSRHHDFNI